MKTAGRRGWSALAALAALALLAGPSCTDETIVLAEVPRDDRVDAGEPPDAQRCATTDDCPRGMYCDKPGCDVPAGLCRRMPSVCPPDERPVCGCDGVTYFNDCLRRLGGVAIEAQGECLYGVSCKSRGECPPGAHCARLVPMLPPDATCPPELPGTCWVVPEPCPPPDTPLQWFSCAPAGRCTSTCQAIADGAPAARADDRCH